jgi:alpha-L-fucosidase 2
MIGEARRRTGSRRRPRPLLAAAVCAFLGAGIAVPSAQATITPPVRGIPYGPAPGETITAFTAKTTTKLATALGGAAATGGAPSVVLVHGGGWRRQLSVTEQAVVADNLMLHGDAVFDVDYPQDTAASPAFPKEPEAVASAISWVKAHATEFGGNPSNIVLLGGSAGGHLVELAGEKTPGVRAVVSLSGPSNLVTLMEMGMLDELKPSLSVSLALALGCGQGGVSWEKILQCGPEIPLAEQYSPVDHVPASECPNWLLFSTEEDLVPVSQSREMLAALQANGCNATLNVLSGKGHSFGYWGRVQLQVNEFISAN